MLFRSALLVAAAASVASAATVVFNCTKQPDICSNDCYAISCLGNPSFLHRDSTDATEHRKENACKSPNRCAGADAYNSCDEYPFASSAEGGSGAVTRCVPSMQNSVQGGTLSSFYTKNSIANGDGYNVGFTTDGNLQYCDGSCSNSGNEVIRRVPQQHRQRYFKTANGVEIMMFEPVAEAGRLDSMVGDKVWFDDAQETVEIVEEVRQAL